ncbi:type I restriction enzyme S subunit [Nocardioides marinisabuli]|uniref:Type I restriction enzyme S subunit n=1 Tax=Nocardioides marinisabuli TaxID=419476 RepID=A0A7Y9F1I1_9ACTN|nr:restriction endonuclease subunit S [Nocardioides marinisabuli]NYD57050.1 type I restriction enzyme S subunit [Nocardioides marinisabuli]
MTSVVTELGQITTWLSGGTPSRANESYWAGDIPWISAFTLKQTRLSDSDQHLTSAAVTAGSKLAPQGAILVLVRGMALHREVRVGIATRPLAFNQDVKALIPGPGVDPEFLVYSLQARVALIRGLVSSAGSGTGVLDTSRLKRLPLWLPSKGEQVQIREMIAGADEQCDALAGLIAKKREIRLGMLQALLTGHVRLPGFDDEWREIVLGDHVSYLRTVPLSREQLDESSPLRCLHYGDIHTRASVRLDAATEAMPRAQAVLAGQAGRLAPGDVVFADASEDPAGVGKSVEITNVPAGGVVPGLHTIAARFDRAVLADGYKAYLQFIPNFRESLLRLAAGTKVLATTRNYISSVRLVVPGVEEQSAIARVLLDADAEIDALERRLESARAIKTGMMQELLTGRTRVPMEVDL